MKRQEEMCVLIRVSLSKLLGPTIDYCINSWGEVMLTNLDLSFVMFKVQVPERHQLQPLFTLSLWDTLALLLPGLHGGMYDLVCVSICGAHQ